MADLFDWLIDPSKRTFYGYWIPTFLIVLLWASLQWQQRKALFNSWFSRSYWWNPSAKQDYNLMIFNRLLFLTLGIAWFAFTIDIAQWMFAALKWFGEPAELAAPSSSLWILSVYTLVLFITDDFTRFWLHRIMHKYEWLWRLHQVHHSANSLNPFTTYRLHPLESLLYQLRASLVHGTCAGAAFFILGYQASSWELWGASAWVIVFNALGANLRHSNIPLRYGRFEKWLISPAQHQQHHGIGTMNTNFGSFLAIWDRLWGSWRKGEPHTRYPSEQHSLVKQLGMRRLTWKP
ncbi:sterol desaturase family protein [Bermanella marisrubri]|uniref:Fatty acid hydroxylase domain-containing protein n=1 Tax=Bermanella marisrubri TaxID=207949 RepID=Q1MZ93_9GAMM|nr:sterol desaturase family protein [Bermanella marisrubri]EAT11240.1 hypothetical protein RED65_08289 [Oceanobacter sp. RED65] [Bermanella marisrubri]QIZ82723.1 sterol desaturase family protein [Bermanella marisrubri]